MTTSQKGPVLAGDDDKGYEKLMRFDRDGDIACDLLSYGLRGDPDERFTVRAVVVCRCSCSEGDMTSWSCCFCSCGGARGVCSGDGGSGGGATCTACMCETAAVGSAEDAGDGERKETMGGWSAAWAWWRWACSM